MARLNITKRRNDIDTNGKLIQKGVTTSTQIEKTYEILKSR